MLERELQTLVIDACAIRGLWALVIPDSRRVAPGWPDLIILGDGGSLFVELKGTDTRLTREQIRMRGRISRAGLAYREWRPSHYKSGEIGRELDKLTA